MSTRVPPVSPIGERHRLTVLFSDLVGSTALGRQIESEYLSEVLSELRKIWHQAAVSHGGRVWDPLESTCRHASLSIL